MSKEDQKKKAELMRHYLFAELQKVHDRYTAYLEENTGRSVEVFVATMKTKEERSPNLNQCLEAYQDFCAQTVIKSGSSSDMLQQVGDDIQWWKTTTEYMTSREMSAFTKVFGLSLGIEKIESGKEDVSFRLGEKSNPEVKLFNVRHGGQVGVPNHFTIEKNNQNSNNQGESNDPIIDDGNCFFDAVSHQLKEQSQHHLIDHRVDLLLAMREALKVYVASSKTEEIDVKEIDAGNYDAKLLDSDSQIYKDVIEHQTELSRTIPAGILDQKRDIPDPTKIVALDNSEEKNDKDVNDDVNDDVNAGMQP